MAEVRIKPWVTQALILVNAAVFVVELMNGANFMAPTAVDMVKLGGSFPPFVHEGQWWRLGTSMFLHFGILHLGLNMLCLYQARIVEAIFGHARMLAIYLVAGLGGGFACLYFGAENAVTVGASGAVFGIYGAFAAFLLVRRSAIPPAVWHPLARSLGSFFVLNLVVGLASEGVSLTAHIGGLIAGASFATGMTLVQRRRAARG
jgi:rhomboid protease GluP